MIQDKKCIVKLLPTDKESRLFLNDNKLYYYHKPQMGDKLTICQHLYILSDDKITDEDYIYHNLDNCVVRYFKTPNDGNIKDYGYKKVIATTNPELIKEGVASIDDEFIINYCYNSIDKVWVEYEEKELYSKTLKGYVKTGEEVKLSSNGSIIIKPLQKTYTDILIDFKNSSVFHDATTFAIFLNEKYNSPSEKK